MDPLPEDLETPIDFAEQLLARILERPSSQQPQAVDEACTEHPEHAETLRQRWRALRAMGLGGSASADDEMRSIPERLGDFRLLDRIGGRRHGGGLSRPADVARPRGRPQADPARAPLLRGRARERFRREVEAVARLKHPGIVPVYMVGEEGGLPFFAMEHLEGCTLAEVLVALQGRAPESLAGSDLATIVSERAGLVDRPRGAFPKSWVEACLQIGRQVAEALTHAHARGILHRDVKPSNVAVQPDGRVMLLDFGLTSSPSQERVTATGAQLGTLFYMSPEQVRGQDTDERTDVYSLGVTLYELLTLQVPYRGEDRQKTEARILDGSSDSIRARNRQVPRDAETVCLKAMDLDPARRYGSAEAFARDLENVLTLRPIEARPPGAALRTRRWVQRNPARAVPQSLCCV